MDTKLVEGPLMRVEDLGPDCVGRIYRTPRYDCRIVAFQATARTVTAEVLTVRGEADSSPGHQWDWEASEAGITGGTIWLEEVSPVQECPGCSKMMIIPEEDYLCRWCRQGIEQ